jgi:hypothetical protein
MSNEKTIHMKKFDGGRRTPAEYHRQLVYGNRQCSTCEQPAAMAAKILADDEEFRRRHPDAYIVLMGRFGGDPAFDTKWGKMVTVEVIYACDQCKDGMRRFVAHRQKDFMHVEFDEMGLEETHPIVKGSA